MSDQHDAPPREAVEALAQSELEQFPGYATFEQQYPSVQAKMRAEHSAGLRALRTLPAAARWRLIAWQAKGLEPTRGMLRALRDTAGDFAPSMDFIIAEIIAAAAEAGDDE